MVGVNQEQFYGVLPFNEPVYSDGVVFTIGRKEEKIAAKQVLVTQNADASNYLLDLQGQAGNTLKVIQIPTHWVDNISGTDNKIIVIWSGGDAGSMVNYQLEITKDKS
jgi:hypothetical protein